MTSVDELPIGTVTFLFTRYRGFDKAPEAVGRGAVRGRPTRHQLILREVFAESGGHEIDTQGDSFFVAFRRAKEALSAAIACQRRLAEGSWPDGTELRVRIGIHTGEPALGGTRYVGLGVHRGARICAAGHGGQVLVSQTTRELLRDDPIPDVTLRDLGEHQLKDIDEPEHLYQVVTTGLREDFPELTAAASAPFEGRAGELAEAAAEELAKGWRRPRRRVLVGVALGAAILGAVVGVLLTHGGGSTADASIAANAVGLLDPRSGKVVAQTPVGVAPGGIAGAPMRSGCRTPAEQCVSCRSSHARRPADDPGRRWPHGPGRHTERGLGRQRPRRNCLADRHRRRTRSRRRSRWERSERRRVR